MSPPTPHWRELLTRAEGHAGSAEVRHEEEDWEGACLDWRDAVTFLARATLQRLGDPLWTSFESWELHLRLVEVFPGWPTAEGRFLRNFEPPSAFDGPLQEIGLFAASDSDLGGALYRGGLAAFEAASWEGPSPGELL